MANFKLNLDLTDSQARSLIQRLARHLYRDEAWECIKSTDGREANNCNCFECKPLTLMDHAINNLADAADVPGPKTLLEVFRG